MGLKDEWERGPRLQVPEVQQQLAWIQKKMVAMAVAVAVAVEHACEQDH